MILFSFSTQAECFPVQTKIILGGKTEIEKSTLCKKKMDDEMLFYVSESCDKGLCEILKRPKKNISVKNYKDNIGSPGFKLCEELGGIPQIFEFKTQAGTWESTERCFFDKADFVEISLLTREWKQYVQSL
jgi:hypothetical protein